MLNVCPVIHVEGDRALQPQIVAVRRDCKTISALYGRREHIEQVETLGDVLDRLGAVDKYGLDRDALVIWISPETNVFCGGDVEFRVGYAKKSVSRYSTYQNEVVYISRQRDGSLETAIAA